KSGKSLNAPNLTGIAATQGLANTSSDFDKVRNTYTPGSCPVGSERKYHINTGNSFMVTSHGCFQDANFHPIPQPSCSDGSELVDIQDPNFAPMPRSLYCPNSVFPAMAMPQLNSEISSLTQSLTQLQSEQAGLVDHGDTPGLLTQLDENASREDLYQRMLEYSPWLSDAVLIRYFQLPQVTESDILDIHNLNAPVSSSVWHALTDVNLTQDTRASLAQQQNQPVLSAMSHLQGRIELQRNRLGQAYNEKASRFMADTTSGSVDSLLAIYDAGIIADGAIHKINILTSSGHFTQAMRMLDDLDPQHPLYADYIFVQSLVINLSSDASFRVNLRDDRDAQQRVEAISDGGNYLAEGIAMGLRQDVWGYRQLDEEKPVPVSASGSPRLAGEDTQSSTVLSPLTVYPNPSSTQITLSGSAIGGDYTVELYNNLGQRVYSATRVTVVPVDMLASGIYLVRVVKGETIVQTKVMVQGNN
ncbi:MAG: T9SS type A sorting domain-containing protein, partial [Bacteroidia bacterium]